ncbi:MAG: acyltransferase [Bacillota bacterium]
MNIWFKKIIRRPLRLFSYARGWLIGINNVDITDKKLPIVLECLGVHVKFKKRKNSKITINGRLIVDKRGMVGAYASPVIEVLENAELVINNNVFIGPNVHIIVGKNGKLIFGEQDDSYTELTHGSKIVADKYIKIGSDCLLSWDLLIMDTSTHRINGKINEQPIEIGNHVWLCARAVIMKGVSIGDNSIVATGAIVTKNVAANTVVGGNPAVQLAQNIIWDH